MVWPAFEVGVGLAGTGVETVAEGDSRGTARAEEKVRKVKMEEIMVVFIMVQLSRGWKSFDKN